MKLILLGPPGAGKGTQAEEICKKFKLPHISTGNMLREAVEAKTPLGLQAKELMDKGILISDEVINALVVDRISKDDCEQGFLFDGYPRTIPQAESLIEAKVKIDYVVEIDVPDQEIITRMSGRRVHAPSGRNYHIKFNPPKEEGKDDMTGEELIQREDDKPETVKDRLDVYRDQTLPLIDFYLNLSKKTELNYLRINGSSSPKEVSEAILNSLD
tara:strand:+ start:706 stop:1350 length:645 start_codon:yes stop_codon:yes gene_type:complete